jgi:hypothetical protein
VAKKYTLDEIKEAFWTTFHKSGEWWFSYFSNDDWHTRCAFTEFLKALPGVDTETLDKELEEYRRKTFEDIV